VPGGVVVASEGGVSVGLDRDGGALVMICERHRVMEAAQLSGTDVGQRMLEFMERHEGCRQHELALHLVG